MSFTWRANALCTLSLALLWAMPADAAPGEPRFLQGIVEWPAVLTGEPVVIVRGDDGHVYSAGLDGARRQGAEVVRVGGRVALLVLEGTRPHEVTAIVIGAGDTVSLSRALAQGALIAPAAVPAPPASTPPAPAPAAAAPPPPAAAPAPPAAVVPPPPVPAPSPSVVAATPPAPVPVPAPAVTAPTTVVVTPPTAPVATPAAATTPVAAPMAAPAPPVAAPAPPLAAPAPLVAAPATPVAAPVAPMAAPATAVAAPAMPAAKLSAPPPPAAAPSPAPGSHGKTPGPAGGRPQWARVDGRVLSVDGALLVLRADNGSLVMVDISQLNPNVSSALRRERLVSVYGYPLEQKFEAAGYIELDPSHPEPPRFRQSR